MKKIKSEKGATNIDIVTGLIIFMIASYVMLSLYAYIYISIYDMQMHEVMVGYFTEIFEEIDRHDYDESIDAKDIVNNIIADEDDPISVALDYDFYASISDVEQAGQAKTINYYNIMREAENKGIYIAVNAENLDDEETFSATPTAEPRITNIEVETLKETSDNPEEVQDLVKNITITMNYKIAGKDKDYRTLVMTKTKIRE